MQMYNSKLLSLVSQGENKVKQTVAKALSNKLQTEVDKNKIVEAIEGIDVGTIVKGLFNLKFINLTIDNETIEQYSNQFLHNIRVVNCPNAITLKTGCFQCCSSIKRCNLTVTKEIYARSFVCCLSLQTLVIKTSSVANMADISAFMHTPIEKGKGYIYVPDELVEDYKVATNWSVYADQIRPISEYKEEEE